ncbi:MAG: 2-C-methyl-D-erythritol 4-phosphate cytidylyltransferase [Bacteroidales bacterium]|jgi:2-C-methyl-D-erythritol 4-phosphate cytidylyltransferase|nr:2-C-methyl-D-erythritol 4-phosphate cytidylyltransferase [Bacteroidales bacterium]
MNLYALVVAGGSGSRMGSSVPKQFLGLAGRPVLMHAIERFYSFDASVKIITVIPENQFGFWEELVARHSFSVPHILAAGGATRFESVRNGLEHVPENSYVAIHDGVRPLVSTSTIRRCFETAFTYGNAIPAIAPSDSVRIMTGQGNMAVNRQYVKLIQTPQVFRTDLIKKACQQKYAPDITDDAMLLEKTGVEIVIVEGNRENIKITNPEDLLIAGLLLQSVS